MRKENWLECLHEYLDSVYDKPFKWGTHDCCYFSASCVEAMTGKNPMKFKYKTKTGALRLIKKIPLDKRLEKIFGKPIALAAAKRGDIMLQIFDGFDGVGVCIGENSLFVGETDREGLIPVPTLSCKKAYSND